MTTSTASAGDRVRGDAAWTVRPHGKLERLSENIWWTWGSLPGMSLKRSMVVVKRSDGDVVVHSAIALDDETRASLEAIGTPRYVIVPNAGHRLDAPAYAKRYPEARFFGPRGGRADIEKVIRLDGTYEDVPPDPAVRFETLRGIGDAEGAMIVESSDGVTVVLNDAVFNMDRKRDVLGFLVTTILGSAPGPRVSRLAKLIYIKDKKAFRAELERFSNLPKLVRLIVSHEKVARGPDAADALRRAMTYL